MKREVFFYCLWCVSLLTFFIMNVLYASGAVSAQSINENDSSLESVLTANAKTCERQTVTTFLPAIGQKSKTKSFIQGATEPVQNGTGYSLQSSPDTIPHTDSDVHPTAEAGSDEDLRELQDSNKTVVHENRAPLLDSIADVVVNEGVTITLHPTATDPDGDELTYAYTGWSSFANHSIPFDNSVMRSVDSDFNGDRLSFSYNGFLTAVCYTTTHDDVGTHTITVTVSDGSLTDSQDIMVTVIDTTRGVVETSDSIEAKNSNQIVSYGSRPNLKDFNASGRHTNRPPMLDTIADITVNEGDTITLHPTATDLDGDSLIFTYSGWMRSSVYKTTLDDSGVHLTTVTVSDGTLTDSQDVTITVGNVNRLSVSEMIMDDSEGAVVGGGFLPNTNAVGSGRVSLQDDSTTDANSESDDTDAQSDPAPVIDTATVDPTDGTTDEGSPGEGTTEVGPHVLSTLVWDPNSEDSLAGYKVYVGNESGVYDSFVDVGAEIGFSLAGLESGLTYFLAVTAYDSLGNESAFSNEVVYTAPIN